MEADTRSFGATASRSLLEPSSGHQKSPHRGKAARGPPPRGEGTRAGSKLVATRGLNPFARRQFLLRYLAAGRAWIVGGGR
ncbi:hypothetical protein HPB47_019711 [Ixodes persulcatus]|uniref:Uncharacterized protein n=1 Tax=Ixodes persulcatus TaxID=34615 RepID=A0AC60QHE9_IXOPE|nr:hypothetical protein HPB47_019711 [Ixodes persulcatus]